MRKRIFTYFTFKAFSINHVQHGTAENWDNLERIQKSAVKIIQGKQYKTYEEALEKIDLQPLNERRDELCLNFAKKCLKNDKMKNLFREGN